MKSLAAVAIGVLLGATSIFGLVKSQSSEPEPVSQPLVTYGTR